MTPKLTINYGLRYELWSPIGEQFGRQSNFDIDTLTLEIPTGPNSERAAAAEFQHALYAGRHHLPGRFSQRESVPRLRFPVPDPVG